MYSPSFSDFAPEPESRPATLEHSIATVMALRERLISNRDLLYLPPVARQLIEREIPILIALLKGEDPPKP
jgi:hypothetical protein